MLRPRHCLSSSLLVLALALTGCAGQEDPAQAKATYCTDLGALGNELAKMAALNPQTATVEQIKQQREAVSKQAEKTNEAATKVQAADTSQLDKARKSLEEAANKLPGNITGQQAMVQLQPQIQAVADAYRQARQSGNCS